MIEYDPIAEIRSALDEIAAAEILKVVEDEHRRKYVKIAVNPANYERVRQAVCNIDPLMESSVLSRSGVRWGQVFFMDTLFLDEGMIP